MGPSDLELLQAWADGDKQAGNRLFDRHFAAVYRFVRNKVGDAADDLVQQSFLACVESRERFDGRSTFRTWLLSVARHKLYDRFRENRRDAARFDPEASSVADGGMSPVSVLGRAAEHRLLLAALRRIPLTSQIALELHYFEKMTGPEIATVLGVPEPTVRSRLRRGLEQLRRKITELADRPELAASTLSDLDAWAEGLAALVAPAAR